MLKDTEAIISFILFSHRFYDRSKLNSELIKNSISNFTIVPLAAI